MRKNQRGRRKGHIRFVSTNCLRVVVLSTSHQSALVLVPCSSGSSGGQASLWRLTRHHGSCFGEGPWYLEFNCRVKKLNMCTIDCLIPLHRQWKTSEDEVYRTRIILNQIRLTMIHIDSIFASNVTQHNSLWQAPLNCEVGDHPQVKRTRSGRHYSDAKGRRGRCYSQVPIPTTNCQMAKYVWLGS